MLLVAPRGEARVLLAGALGGGALRAEGALRLPRGEGGDADAHEEEDEGPAEAESHGFGCNIGFRPPGDNGGGVRDV